MIGFVLILSNTLYRVPYWNNITNGPIVTWVVLNSLHDFHFNLKVNMAMLSDVLNLKYFFHRNCICDEIVP
jgi:hypothetical protein